MNLENLIYICVHKFNAEHNNMAKIIITEGIYPQQQNK
jgi:hypothetical protein